MVAELVYLQIHWINLFIQKYIYFLNHRSRRISCGKPLTTISYTDKVAISLRMYKLMNKTDTMKLRTIYVIKLWPSVMPRVVFTISGHTTSNAIIYHQHNLCNGSKKNAPPALSFYTTTTQLLPQ